MASKSKKIKLIGESTKRVQKIMEGLDEKFSANLDPKKKKKPLKKIKIDMTKIK